MHYDVKRRIERKMDNNLVGAFEASADHFGDAIHAVLGLLDDGVDFGERRRFADRRIFHRKLQLLDVSWNLIDVVEQFLLQSTGRHLCA